MRTTLDLPDDLFRQAKIHAAVKGISLKELFTDALRIALKSQVINPAHLYSREGETPSEP